MLVEAMGAGRPASRRTPVGSRGFTLPPDDAPEMTRATAVPGSAALGGLLELPGGEPPPDREAATRAHVGAMLRELAGLQHALLGGGDPRTVLGRLDLLAEPASDGPPALLSVLAAVRLRARVELARWPEGH